MKTILEITAFMICSEVILFGIFVIVPKLLKSSL